MTDKYKNKPETAIRSIDDLSKLQNGSKIKLDCGHYCTVGHNLANTLIIYSLGSGRIETKCHNCGY